MSESFYDPEELARRIIKKFRAQSSEYCKCSICHYRVKIAEYPKHLKEVHGYKSISTKLSDMEYAKLIEEFLRKANLKPSVWHYYGIVVSLN